MFQTTWDLKMLNHNILQLLLTIFDNIFILNSITKNKPCSNGGVCFTVLKIVAVTLLY